MIAAKQKVLVVNEFRYGKVNCVRPDGYLTTWLDLSDLEFICHGQPTKLAKGSGKPKQKSKELA